MIEAVKSRLAERLEKIVGSRFVSTNPADLYIYSYDLTPAEPHSPDVVVLPQSVEEVRAVLKLADQAMSAGLPFPSTAASRSTSSG
jgi:FAD/FMN-containing dehydrogenase